MLNETLLIGFIVAALVVLVIPGPGVVFVIAQSVAHGYRAGLASVVGLSVGAMVHVIAATVGLSAILLTSATAFGIIKFIGAGYLIYLGVKTLLSRPYSTDIETPAPMPLRRLFIDGVVISIFNPKIAMFFLAFLPQFVDLSLGAVPLQIMLLGTIYAVLALFTDGAYAVLAGGAHHWLQRTISHSPWPRRITGNVYIGLGINTSLASQRN